MATREGPAAACGRPRALNPPGPARPAAHLPYEVLVRQHLLLQVQMRDVADALERRRHLHARRQQLLEHLVRRQVAVVELGFERRPREAAGRDEGGLNERRERKERETGE